jgi:streptomycin 6-kinase
VADLYEAGLKNYERRPELASVVPPELYERGRQLAMRLAADAPTTVLLHGDLTPANILDGGEARGLVAVDPAPCLGDPAFDAIDLVLWRAADQQAVTARAARLAPDLGTTTRRLAQWCSAFAAMTALELAEATGPRERVDVLVQLAAAEAS